MDHYLHTVIDRKETILQKQKNILTPRQNKYTDRQADRQGKEGKFAIRQKNNALIYEDNI